MELPLADDFYEPGVREQARLSDHSEASVRNALNDALRRPRVRQGQRCKRIATAGNRPSLPCLNYYRHWITSKGDHFISVDTGAWCVLSEGEYRALAAGMVGPELERKLEKNFVLLTERNYDTYIEKMRAKFGFLREGPTLHIVVVTSNCNLKCVYCQVSAPTSAKCDMDNATAKVVVDRILESPSDSYIIEFQGGEPLLNFSTVQYIIEYSESLAASRGKRIEYSLISNFTRSVTAEKLRYLIAHNVSICFSLDGPQELHDANRGVGYPGAFEELVRSLDLYRSEWLAQKDGQIPLSALMTTTRRSLSEHKAIIDQYCSLGLRKISLRPLTPLGNASDNADKIDYSPREFFDFWCASIEYIIELRRNGTDINDFYLELALTKLFGNESGFMDLRSPCGAAYGQITYNHDGGVYSCDEGRMIDGDDFFIGAIAQQSLGSILRSPDAAAIVESSISEQYYCDYCAFKPYCGVCPVLHRQQKGRMAMNVLESSRCQVMSMMYSHVLEKYIYDTQARAAFDDILVGISWQRGSQ